MKRTEKAAEIEVLKSRFSSALVTILADYKGLKMTEMTALRTKLKEKDSGFNVVKNRLAKIAIKDTPFDDLASHFVGTTAVSTSQDDLSGPAKVLVEFAKEHEALKIKAGFLNGKVIQLADVKKLADLPSKEELLAKMLGSMQAPITNWVSVLSQIPRQLVTVLNAVREHKEKN
ncbi:50S ribosomal protein L10 [bacterium K02(2017)]|nr:50S ribosomal protein L10 [bacterium K02(2017)]